MSPTKKFWAMIKMLSDWTLLEKEEMINVVKGKALVFVVSFIKRL